VYPVEIFIQYSALYNEQAAILLSAPLVVITVLAIGLQAGTMRGRSYINFQGGRDGSLRYPLGKKRLFALLFCLGVLGLAVIVPVAALFQAAGPAETYIKAVGSSTEQILVSFALAGLAAALMTILAVAVAAAIHRATGVWRTVAEYVSQIPFAIPPIVLGIGMIKLWNRPVADWLYTTPLIVVLGYVAHFVPFAIRAVYANLQQVSPRLVEAGRLARKSGLVVTWRIALPLLRNGLLTGFFIAFVLAMGELGVTLLVTPPGTATIPIKIYNFMHYGAEATVAALCLVLVASQLVLGGFLFGVGRWLKEGGQ
jgi:iron(III) transport system permease protein